VKLGRQVTLSTASTDHTEISMSDDRSLFSVTSVSSVVHVKLASELRRLKWIYHKQATVEVTGQP
jgi:hypothetical protein